MPRRHRHLFLSLVAVALACLATFALPAPLATAGFPGRPGLIAFDDARNPESCEGDVFTADPVTGEVTEIAAGAQPRFSPDGRRIVYVTCGGEHSRVSIMDADGSGSHVVIGGDFSASEPSFSPDGRRILYRRIEGRAGLTGIWGADADGSHRPLFAGGRVGRHPSYSPDGRLIVFAYEHRIFTMRPSGRHVRPLAAGAAPAVSPDGHTVVYSDRGGIWTIRLDGSHRRQLNRQYSSGRHGRVRGLHVRNVSPTWSPDGGLILFDRVGNRGNADQRSHLWTMRPDGTEMRRLELAPAEPTAPYRPDWQALP